jgi:hypothetical protein
MLPGKILRFLNEQANMAFAGLRDKDLRPSGCRISAWKIAPDGRTVTAYVPVPEQFREHFLGCLLDNRQFVMTVEEHPTHETYQLKGTYLRHRPASSSDMELVRQNRERLARSMRQEFPPGMDVRPFVQMMHPDPTFAVEVDIREVFVQTPGPGAGARLHPPPEA